MEQFEYTTPQYKKTDYITLAVSTIGLALFLLLLFSDTAFNLLFGTGNKSHTGPLLGTVAYSENDVRRKDANSFAWQDISTQKEVYLGDGIFTGSKSRSQVKLNNGTKVDLSENSLVIFSRIDGIEVPDLDAGNIKVSMNGSLKIAINGKITELKGENAEVQVVLDKNSKPQVRLLSGSATIKPFKSQGYLSLKPNNNLTLESHGETGDLIAKVPKERPSPIVKYKIPEVPQNKVNYTDQLYDLYEVDGNTLSFRENLPETVQMNHKVEWIADKPVNSTFLQLASNPDFQGAVKSYQTSESNYTLPTLFVGNNYWRLSADGQKWTGPNKFYVNTQLLAIPPPVLSAESTVLELEDSRVDLKLNVQSPPEISQHILEMSQDPNFRSQSVRILWLKENRINYPFISYGTYYIRSRGINSSMEMTSYSKIMEVKVNRPPFKALPRLALDKNKIYLGDSFDIAWNPTEKTKLYNVKVTNAQGQTVHQSQTAMARWNWKPNEVGEYAAQIQAVDVENRASSEKATSSLSVLARPEPPPKPPAPVAQQEPPRTPASTPPPVTSTMQTPYPPPMPADYMNRTFTNSNVNVEGALFTMYSTTQQTNESGLPVAALGGIRYFRWTDVAGFEGIFRTKMVGLSAEAQGVSPMQLEARYHLRWHIPWNLLSNAGGSKLSLLAGFELYKNTTAGLYANQYQLLKTGFTLQFPLKKAWDTGGEVLYGKGFDDSTKYEISGYLNYFLKPEFAMGVGYRIHLFEAGSRKSFPSGVADYFEGYREGYGEGYSVLRWYLK